MLLAIYILTGLCVIATILPLWRHPHWLIRAMDFPRMQLAILAAFLLLAQILVLDLDRFFSWILMAVTLACLAWQAWWVLPYTRLWQKEVKTARVEDSKRIIRILTANVLTPNKRADKLLQLVSHHCPDILVTLESDTWWQSKLDALEAQMPFSIKCPLDNLYGMHVYSRLKLDHVEIGYLVENDIPSMHASVTLDSGDRVRAHFLHPAPPSPTENPESAERDAELVVVAKSVIESDQPVIVTGDLNDVAWSATTRLFRKLSGLLDPRVGRGMFNTFHSNYPFLRWPLDHLFHTKHFTVSKIERLPYFGSDHFALLTELYFNPIHGQNQRGVEADKEDHEWSREITREKQAQTSDVPEPGE